MIFHTTEVISTLFTKWKDNILMVIVATFELYELPLNFRLIWNSYLKSK